jgi:zinc protease
MAHRNPFWYPALIRSIAVSVVALFTTPLAGWSAEPVMKKLAEVEGISHYELPNGCQVLFFPDASKPTVTVNITVFVGSRHEGYGEAGMAHLLEHMVFKGTPNHPKIPDALKNRGAQFNGTTWLDRTNYYETLPATPENLEFAIGLEADRLINSNILAEDLASEFSVVRSEFEQGENNPQRVLMQRMTAAAFEWHNYGKTTIGNRSDIERVPIENLRAFYKKFYRPDNVLLTIAGRFQPEEAQKFIEKHFGVLPKPANPIDRTYTVEPPQDGERSVVVRRVGKLQLATACYHIPSGGHPDFAPLTVLTRILSDEPTGRLYKALVEAKLATRAGGYAIPTHDAGLFNVIASVDPDKSLDDAQKILLEVTENVAQSPITEEEVTRAIDRIISEREQEMTDAQSVAVTLSDWASQGDWRLFFLYRDRVEAVTADDVMRVAKTYLKRNNRTSGLFIPTDQTERISVPETPDLLAALDGYKGRDAVSEGEAFDPEPELIEQRTTRGTLVGGIRTAFLPKKTRGNTVSIALTLRYGNPESLRGYEAAGDMLPALVERGTRSMNYQQLQDKLSQSRTSLGVSGQLGLLQIGGQTKRENLKEVLQMVTELARYPTLPESEFEILKQQQLAALKAQLTEPQPKAMRLMQRILNPYPQGDIRYVPTLEESITRAESLTIDQIKELHTKFLGNQAGELSIVGDFDPSEVEPMLAEAFDSWKSDVAFARSERPAQTQVSGRSEEIKTPDKANMVFVAGQQFVLDDKAPEYAALQIANFIFGNSALTSRLGNRVRQKEGLSYGVGCRLESNAKDQRGMMMVYAIANPTNRDKLIATIHEEVDKLVRDGITAEELETAKQGFLEGEKVKFTEDGYITDYLGGSLFLDRTLEYDVWLRDQVAKLTVDDVNAAIRKFVDPKRFVECAAGDFK